MSAFLIVKLHDNKHLPILRGNNLFKLMDDLRTYIYYKHTNTNICIEDNKDDICVYKIPKNKHTQKLKIETYKIIRD